MVPKLNILAIPDSHTIEEYGRCYYSPNSMRFNFITLKSRFLNEEIYSWMIENIGDEYIVMRTMDRAQYMASSQYGRSYDSRFKSISKLEVQSPSMFETNNPKVDRSRCNWDWIPGEGIRFRKDGLASVYKLAWF